MICNCRCHKITNMEKFNIGYRNFDSCYTYCFNEYDYVDIYIQSTVRNKMELFQSPILFLSTQQLADRPGDQQAVERLETKIYAT